MTSTLHDGVPERRVIKIDRRAVQRPRDSLGDELRERDAPRRPPITRVKISSPSAPPPSPPSLGAGRPNAAASSSATERAPSTSRNTLRSPPLLPPLPLHGNLDLPLFLPSTQPHVFRREVAVRGVVVRVAEDDGLRERPFRGRNRGFEVRWGAVLALDLDHLLRFRGFRDDAGGRRLRRVFRARGGGGGDDGGGDAVADARRTKRRDARARTRREDGRQRRHPPPQSTECARRRDDGFGSVVVVSAGGFSCQVDRQKASASVPAQSRTGVIGFKVQGAKPLHYRNRVPTSSMKSKSSWYLEPGFSPGVSAVVSSLSRTVVR